MTDFLMQNNWLIKIIATILILVIAISIYKLLSNLTEKALNKNKRFNKRAQTYIRLAKSINRYIIIIIALMIVLKIYGIDISSMLAGLGIISVIVGLAIQDYLKDIIRGSSIISDDYFSVGDVINYRGIEGKVLVVGLKTTKIQELSTGNIFSIANRNIEEIAILSNLIYVRVPIPYELKLKEQQKAVNEVVKLIKADDLIINCENVGLTELADSKIEYLLKITCNPINRLQARRNALSCIVEGLEKNNISIPYNQLDIHQK